MWLYHKPAGLVTTNKDPEGRPTVFDNLPEDLPRVMSIGRLDINTEGLLLLTNDGGLARTLELPQTGWLRRYRVRAYGDIDQARLDQLKDGIAVDGVLYGAIEAVLDRTQGHNVWMTIGLREGKNREIKNVLGALGLDVNRLIRISFGPFQLGDIAEGDAVEIKSRTLREQLGERLAEESGANFDAPVVDRRQKPEPQDERPARRGRTFGEEGGRDWVSAGEPRERGRDRLDTKPRTPPRRRGAANVWMAPGARPEGSEKKPKRSRPDGESSTRRSDAPRGRAARPADGRPERGEGKRFDKAAPRRERTEEGRAPRRADASGYSRSERPQRDDRPPRADRPRREGENQSKPFRRDDRRPSEGRSDRPEGRTFDKPFGGKPRGKPFGKPAGASAEGRESRSFDKAGVKPGDKPRGKPFGKPGGRPERSAGGAAGAGKPSAGRGGKPFGKSGDSRPGGGKPGGRPGGRSGGGKPGGRPGGGAPRAGGGPKGRGGADRQR